MRGAMSGGPANLTVEQSYGGAAGGDLRDPYRPGHGASRCIHEAGSTAIFDNQPFERRLRDMNSVSQQLQGRRTHFETVGLYLLGGEPNLRRMFANLGRF